MSKASVFKWHKNYVGLTDDKKVNVRNSSRSKKNTLKCSKTENMVWSSSCRLFLFRKT